MSPPRRLGQAETPREHGERSPVVLADGQRLWRGWVALPCPIHSTGGGFRRGGGAGIRVRPEWKVKARRTAELAVAALSLPARTWPLVRVRAMVGPAAVPLAAWPFGVALAVGKLTGPSEQRTVGESYDLLGHQMLGLPNFPQEDAVHILELSHRLRGGRMLFRILGPLRVQEEFEVTSPVRRAFLTALLLRSGQPIGITELTDLLWDSPPCSARANIRSHLTGLRRDLDMAVPGLRRRIRTCRGARSGYEIDAELEEVDLPKFVRAVRQGRNCLARGEVAKAIAVLEDAVALWRGPFGQDLPMTRWFDAHSTGLRNGRLDTYEDLFTALVLAGRTEWLSYRIETIIAEAPYRQRLWELLTAVYCVQGDSPGALNVIKRCRTVFVNDLGLDVPPSVDAMRNAALTWDGDEALRMVARWAPCQARAS